MTATGKGQPGRTETIEFSNPEGSIIKRVLIATRNHRYWHIPVLRVETLTGSLCGYGQIGTTFQKIYRYSGIHDAEVDIDTTDAFYNWMKQEVFKRLETWEELQPTIIELAVDKGPARNHAAKGDRKYLIQEDGEKPHILDLYGTRIELEDGDYIILKKPNAG